MPPGAQKSARYGSASVKIVVDMNLPPRRVEVLTRHGWESVHWSTVGKPDATDRAIMDWALDEGYVVFTHDLDFGAILATTRASGPSVIQIRTQDVFPEAIERTVVTALRQYEDLLMEGSLIVVDEMRARARILPLHE